jgi:CDP-glucose 4,6-dehydratase
VLVTGCTGLLGSWLCRSLGGRGARVRGLALGEPPAGGAFERFGLAGSVDVLEGELADAALLTRAASGLSAGCVFHLAAQSQHGAARRDPGATFEANVRGTWLLLEALRRGPRPAAVVLASSVAVYGDRGEEPHAEEEPLPVGGPPYGASKAAAEAVGLSYHHTVGLPVCVARCSNLYGGGDTNTERIVPGTVDALLKGEPPVIRSDGRARRDYLYVEDAVRGFLALAEAAEGRDVAGRVFNLGSGQVVSVLDLVEAILRRGGRDDIRPRVLGEPSDEMPVRRVSVARARGLLGWSPEFSLDRGLDATIDWHRTAACAPGPARKEP